MGRIGKKKNHAEKKHKVIGALEESCPSLLFGNYLELVSSNGFLSFDCFDSSLS